MTLPPLGHLVHPIGTFLLLMVIVEILWSIGHWVRMLPWSPLNNVVRGRWDRGWLLAEMWLPMCFCTRFIHGGPAVVREARSTERNWFEAVLTLIKRARYAIMDVSEIEPGSGLAWELETCYSRRVNLLLTCDTEARDRALVFIRSLLPKAVVLPDDFRDVERFSTLGKPGVAVVQLFSYGEGLDTFGRFHAQSGVFFGEITLGEWFDAIVHSRPSGGSPHPA